MQIGICKERILLYCRLSTCKQINAFYFIRSVSSVLYQIKQTFVCHYYIRMRIGSVIGQTKVLLKDPVNSNIAKSKFFFIWSIAYNSTLPSIPFWNLHVHRVCPGTAWSLHIWNMISPFNMCNIQNDVFIGLFDCIDCVSVSLGHMTEHAEVVSYIIIKQTGLRRPLIVQSFYDNNYLLFFWLVYFLHGGCHPSRGISNKATKYYRLICRFANHGL